MGNCRICDKTSPLISKELGLCLDCIRSHPQEAEKIALNVHSQLRTQWCLPKEPPRHPNGVSCNLCVNRCRIGKGERGYCGIRKNVAGRLQGVGALKGKFSWYHDPLLTNCVGDWVCAGGTGCGYPQYAHCKGAEYGFDNLAVFPYACTFHCLYCQNWHFRNYTLKDSYQSIEDLTGAVKNNTACICYFGGDPSPQIPMLLKASRKAIDESAGRILRICWETNGAMSRTFLDDMAQTTLSSGGCIKFDLKAWDETLHMALTGVTNRLTFENFAWLAEKINLRPEPPFLIASTLMVPGYIDEHEVKNIAVFIAALNPEIPYSLLAFHPQYKMCDLPPTTRKQADACVNAARKAGLNRIKVGNTHLLW